MGDSAGFEKIFLMMFVLICCTVFVYGVRVVGGSIMSRESFVGFPRRTDQSKLVECFCLLAKLNLNTDGFQEVVRGLNDHDFAKITGAFQALQTAGCGCFHFPLDVGARMYVPPSSAFNKEQIDRLCDDFKSSAAESYI